MDQIGTEWITYAVVLAGVSLGALVPVVPTGALVSAAAALAVADHYVLGWLLVPATAAAAALVGDVALLALLAGGSGPLRRWYTGRVAPERLRAQERRLEQRPVLVLVLSRLVPGGRIPVLLAAVVTGRSWRWFLTGNAVAVLAWAGVYTAAGALGGVLFAEEWQAVVLALALVLAIGVGPQLVRRVARRS